MTVYTKDKSGKVEKKLPTTPLSIEQESFCSKVTETSKAALTPKVAPIKPTKDNS